MLKFIRQLTRDEDGLTAVEYSMIALVILVFIVLSVTVLGTYVSRSLNTVGSSINTTTS
jgi:pilus assembly protein Flp/PilA